MNSDNVKKYFFAWKYCLKYLYICNRNKIYLSTLKYSSDKHIFHSRFPKKLQDYYLLPNGNVNPLIRIIFYHAKVIKDDSRVFNLYFLTF